jgi:tetratricopeptide (TPR) repeat protein
LNHPGKLSTARRVLATVDSFCFLHQYFSGKVVLSWRNKFAGITVRRSTVARFASMLVLANRLVQPSAAQISGQTRRPSTGEFATLAAQAEQASQQDRLDDAIVLYRKALAVNPSWSEGWWSLGTIHYDRNAFKEAASAFRRAVALEPKKGSPRVMLGLCQFELGDDDNALKNIQAGRELGTNPDRQFQRVMLYHEGVLLLRKSRFESATDIFTELAKEGVQSQEVTLGFGMAALRIVPKSLPEDGTPGREVVDRVGWAESLARLKRFDEARQAYEQLVRDFPAYPDLQYAYGRFLLEMNDADGAVDAFQQEIKNSPQNVLARLRIAAVRYRVNSSEALPYAQEAVKLAPNLPFAHYLYGLLLLDTGDFQQAIPNLETAVKGLDSEPGIYFALGTAYAKAGRKQEAARARATFLRLSRQANASAAHNTDAEQPSLPSPDRASEASPPR